MSPDLRKVRDTSSQVRYEHPHGNAWIGALAGAAMVAVALLTLEGGGRWALAAFGGLILYSGVYNGLYRTELTLDFARRRYSWRRGPVSSIETGEGAFDDIEAVVLKKELDRKSSNRVEEWEVELVLGGWPRPVEVLETRDEGTARAEAEDLARRIGVELRERTTT